MEYKKLFGKYINDLMNKYNKLKDNSLIFNDEIYKKNPNLEPYNLIDTQNYSEDKEIANQEQNIILSEELDILRDSLFELNKQNDEKEKLLSNYQEESNRLRESLFELNQQKDEKEKLLSNYEEELIHLRKSLFELNEQKNEKEKLLTNYQNENNKLRHNLKVLEDEAKMNFDLLVELKSNLENLKNERENYKDLSLALEHQLNRSVALFGKLIKIKKIKKTRIDFQSIELDILVP